MCIFGYIYVYVYKGWLNALWLMGPTVCPQRNPNNSVVAFCDNSSAIRGFEVRLCLYPCLCLWHCRVEQQIPQLAWPINWKPRRVPAPTSATSVTRACSSSGSLSLQTSARFQPPSSIACYQSHLFHRTTKLAMVVLRQQRIHILLTLYAQLLQVKPMLPVSPGNPSALAPQRRDWDLLLTAETHNFPCAVAPYPGAVQV